MSTRKITFLAIGLTLAAIFGFSLLNNREYPIEIQSGNDVAKNKIIEQLLISGIQQAHYNQIVYDDKLSEKSFYVYLSKLDPTKHYFLKEDIEQLKAFQHKLDDEIKGAEIPFYNNAVELWRKRMSEAKAYYKEILSQPFDFEAKESVELDPEKRDFAPTKDALKEEWRKFLKYSALTRYYSRLENQEQQEKDAKIKGKPFTKKSNIEISKEVSEQLMKDYNDRFDYFEKLDDEDLFSDYMNSIIGVYCPHTEFFPPQKKENFDFSLSGRMEGIGARLQQTEGNIKVAEIVMGSASWRQGELKAEDIILKVAQENEEAVSVEGVSIKKAVSLIRGKKGTTVRLTVKKPDGRIVEIPIVRDVVVQEESYVKSAILERDGKKYGLIYLPSFYADFNKSGGRSSAADVREELVKLKNQKADAIILDLRNNGGGSLQDAIEMSGLFIEQGPVVQVKGRETAPLVLKDRDSDTEYDGALVILINKFSASASEILAGAMQDYERAVIVGSASFGKGTVQRFIELDAYLPPSMASMKPLGSLKLTVQKFYRITGASTQVRGVTPDISLPDSYAQLEVGEKDLDFVLPWDEISPSSYEKWKNSSELNLPKLAKNSEERLKQNEIFKLIADNGIRLKKQREQTFQTLNFKEFEVQQKALKAESEKYKNLSKEHSDLQVKSTSEWKPQTQQDSVKFLSDENWRKELKKDVYIYEATKILEDMIKK
ncbi:MAG: carboxy terminal-processing peptidase [Flammeovirgaceae bacterium]